MARGASPNATDMFETSLLHFAALQGRVGPIAALIDAVRSPLPLSLALFLALSRSLALSLSRSSLSPSFSLYRSLSLTHTLSLSLSRALSFSLSLSIARSLSLSIYLWLAPMLTSRGGLDAAFCGKDSYRGTSLIRIAPPSLGPPHGPRHSPTVGSYEGVVSYERGSPVSEPVRRTPLPNACGTYKTVKARLWPWLPDTSC